MLFSLYQYYKITFRPRFNGWLFKLLFSGNRIKVGKSFCCHTWPTIQIDKGANLIIGDNVLFKRNVEIRSHGSAKIEFLGDNRIDRGVRILACNESIVSIGKNSRIGLYSVLNGGDSIHLGNEVLISGYVYLQTSMHRHEGNQSIQKQGYEHSSINLQDDVWIGVHAVILPGCELGRGTIVGSNAVVTKSFPSDVVLAGIPAKVLKNRD
ncbi:MAG: acetyltransferase-like isoleucine patch superfamily enzyme [Patiriisocius sp.]|jgi:acetyltransferase-like isoleucine patch superfamily enzyme